MCRLQLSGVKREKGVVVTGRVVDVDVGLGSLNGNPSFTV